MPASKNKRGKQYKPRALDANPVMKLVRASVSKEACTDEIASELELIPLTAIDCISKGVAGRSEWDSLARAINHANMLAANGIGSEAAPVIDEAEKAMLRVKDRYVAGKGIAFDGHGLQAVRAAISIWGQMLRICNIGEVDAATRAVESHYWSAA